MGAEKLNDDLGGLTLFLDLGGLTLFLGQTASQTGRALQGINQKGRTVVAAMHFYPTVNFCGFTAVSTI